jgi:predicted ribosomally synthesized peptide with nif11-like leader
MSEAQLTALLAKLKEDAGLREKLQGAADLDSAVALAKEAGFDVSKADWLKYQANQTLELSDEELEGVAGGLYMKGGPRKEDLNKPADPPGGQKPMPFTHRLPFLGGLMYLGGGC